MNRWTSKKRLKAILQPLLSEWMQESRPLTYLWDDKCICSVCANQFGDDQARFGCSRCSGTVHRTCLQYDIFGNGRPRHYHLWKMPMRLSLILIQEVHRILSSCCCEWVTVYALVCLED